MHYGTLTQALQSRARSHTGMTLIESGNSERAVPYSPAAPTRIAPARRSSGRGLRPGDELVLFAADNWLLIEALWACLLGGIVPALVAANARPECRQKLRSALAALRSPALFTGLTQFEMLSAAEAKGIVPALPAPCPDLDRRAPQGGGGGRGRSPGAPGRCCAGAILLRQHGGIQGHRAHSRQHTHQHPRHLPALPDKW